MKEIHNLNDHTATKSYKDSTVRFYFNKILVLKESTENKTRMIEELWRGVKRIIKWTYWESVPKSKRQMMNLHSSVKLCGQWFWYLSTILAWFLKYILLLLSNIFFSSSILFWLNYRGKAHNSFCKNKETIVWKNFSFFNCRGRKDDIDLKLSILLCGCLR